jgi:sterol 3beta-glucosyltransferase
MHVTLLTLGSQGDVQPFVALGRGLRSAGHQVRVISHAAFQPLAESYGLEFGLVPTNPHHILTTDAGQAWVETGTNMLGFVRQQMKLASAFARQILDEVWAACEPATDLIIFSVFGIPGYHLAEKLGVPRMAAWLQPLSRTAAFPSLIVPPTWNFSPSFNRLTHRLAEHLTWLPFQTAFNRWRVETLSLPPLPASGPFKQIYRQQMPILYAFSPTMVPPPSDWPAWISVTGYWFLDRPAAWQPPAELVEFLAAGPAPVYIGFGSMPSRRPTALLNLVVEALQASGQRGLLLTGWGGLAAEAQIRNSDRVFILESAPHDWLFPQMAVLVHHGGAGTTAAGLRAGVPSIIIPFFADQPFWGQRLADLGVGPKPIMPKDLTAAHLAQAMRTAASDPAMRAKAITVGRCIRSENGVERAVQAIESFMAKTCPLAPAKF